MSAYLIGLGLFVVNFILKFIPRIRSGTSAADTITHFHIIRDFQRNRGIPRHLTGFILNDSHNAVLGYPFLMHAILAPFPLPFLEKVEKLIGPFVSSLDVMVVYIFVLLAGQSELTALYTTGFYMFVPVMIRAAPYLTPRIFGILFVNIALASAILFSVGYDWAFFAVSVIVGAAVFMLHKFSAQAYIAGLLSILLAASEKPWVWLIVAGVLLILAIPLYSLYLKRILLDHLAVLRWHIRNPKELRRSPLLLAASEVWFTPLLIPFVVFLVYDPAFFLSNMLYRTLFAWGAGLFLMAWAMKYIKKLRFLGEGDRYKDYNALPVALLVVSYVLINPALWNIVLLAVAGALCLIGTAGETLKLLRVDRGANKEIEAISASLRELSGDRVWGLGPNLNGRLHYWTGKSVLGLLSGRTLLKETDLYPVIRKPYKYFIDRYAIDYLVVDEKYLDIGQADLGPYREIAREGRYLILEVLREVGR